MMDQGVSYEAIEGLKDQKAVKVVIDRQQAMDQKIRYGSRSDGSGKMIGAMDGHAMDQG
jgi:hypothetical protein